MTGTVPVGGAFALTDHVGDRVTDADYLGRFTLVFFGFTHCRSVCPRALAKLTDALGRLGDRADAVQPLYITVDPDRDTPDVLRAYLATTAPDAGFVGLTGSAQEIDAAKAAYRVYAHRGPALTDGGYDVPHTAFAYLMDPDGRYRTHFGDAEDTETIAARLAKEIDAFPSLE